MVSKYLILLSIFMISLSSADILSTGATGGDEILLGYGNQVDTFFSFSETTQGNIPEDIDGLLTKTATKITSNELLGKGIIVILLLMLIFFKDIIKLIKRIKLKEW